MLTAKSLRGVWALVTTPWNSKNDFDEEVFRHDVACQCRSGVHGLYTTGSSGEFFALDFEEFRRLVDVFLDEVKKTRTPHQIGCGAADTRGTLRRVECAVERGAQALQIVFPYYIELTRREAFAFLKDVARAAGAVPLVHYNSPYAKPILEADDYRALVQEVPTIIGTKLPSRGPLWFAAICERVPELSHFTGEYAFVADFAAGARGIYSWLAVTNPRLAVAWHDACAKGDYSRAMEIQVLVNRYKIHVKSAWRGQSDAAVNKADAALNPSIRTPLRVRSPYVSCTRKDLERARRWARKNFPELLEL
ncbi:MAG: dihydrodipicolinate synthase family protein [Planctomycetota bacterium]